MEGYSGTKAGIGVNLHHLSTLNHDPHVVGEDGSSIAQAKEWKEAPDASKSMEKLDEIIENMLKTS